MMEKQYGYIDKIIEEDFRKWGEYLSLESEK